MICPYCGDEMEQGVIQSPYQIFWAPGDKRHGAGNADFHDGSIVLSKLSFFKGSAVEAHVCRGCKKLVIDFGNEKSDFNAR